MSEEVPIGAVFRHYKGKLYKVIQIGRHTEEETLHVVYHAVDDSVIWIRPLKMFLESVTINGQEVPRFERVQ